MFPLRNPHAPPFARQEAEDEDLISSQSHFLPTSPLGFESFGFRPRESCVCMLIVSTNSEKIGATLTLVITKPLNNSSNLTLLPFQASNPLPLLQHTEE